MSAPSSRPALAAVRPTFHIDHQRIGRVVHVRISGSLGEPLAPRLGELRLRGQVVLDVGGVHRITSLGIRAWMDAVSRLPPEVEGLYVVNATPALVDQYLMVSGFGGAAHLLSVLAPYSCDNCGDEVVRSIHLRASEELIHRGEPPRFLCASCRGSLRFTDSTLDFAALAALVPQAEPHPAVTQYLASAITGPQRGEAPTVKLVSGDLTFLALRGALSPQLNLRRHAEGLDGRAVYDFASVTEVLPGGIRQLGHVLRSAQASAQAIYLWRVPPIVARGLLGERLGQGVCLQSLWLTFPCSRCDRSAPRRVSAREYIEWLEDGTVAARPCLTCSTPAAPEHHPDLLPLLRAHPPGDVADAELEPLEISSLAQQLFRRDAFEHDTSVWDRLVEVRGLVQQLRQQGESSITGELDRVDALIEAAGEAVRERERTQRLVFGASEVGKLAVTLTDPARLVELSLEVIARVLEADRAGIFLFPGGGAPGPDAETLPGGAVQVGAWRVRGKPSRYQKDPLCEAILADVRRDARPLQIRNVLSDDRYLGLGQSLFPGKAVLAAPLLEPDGGVRGVVYAESSPLNFMFEPRGIAFLESSASHVAAGLERADFEQQSLVERRTRERLSRYFSDAVLQEIVEGRASPGLGGVRRNVTVLFTDVRNASALLQSLEPETAVQVLNEYFGFLIEELLAEQGTIDKFTGDGLMALWNAPTDQPDHAVRAVRAALRIGARLPKLLDRWRAKGAPWDAAAAGLTAGIGIHTGLAVVGSIGSAKRMEYTAIGDAVHLPVRVQGLCRGSELLVTEATFSHLPPGTPAERLEPVALEGRDAPTLLFRVKALPPTTR